MLSCHCGQEHASNRAHWPDNVNFIPVISTPASLSLKRAQNYKLPFRDCVSCRKQPWESVTPDVLLSNLQHHRLVFDRGQHLKELHLCAVKLAVANHFLYPFATCESAASSPAMKKHQKSRNSSPMQKTDRLLLPSRDSRS